MELTKEQEKEIFNSFNRLPVSYKFVDAKEFNQFLVDECVRDIFSTQITRENFTNVSELKSSRGYLQSKFFTYKYGSDVHLGYGILIDFDKKTWYVKYGSSEDWKAHNERRCASMRDFF